MPNAPHILVVDSQAKTRFQLRNILLDAGYDQVSEVACGLETVHILRTEPVDLLVVNIDVTGLDCWRLARLVRSGIFLCEGTTPIVLVAETWCERIAETTAREFGINELLPMGLKEKLPDVVKACLEQPAKPFKNPRILVVEDNPDTGHVAQRALQQRFDVEIAMDGSSGLAAWKERYHDLVLLDVMLPGMSGPEVLDAILALDKQQPVVIMTAYSTMDLAEELMLKGAVDFIAKPFRADQLRRVCELAARREDYLVSNAQFAARLTSLQDSHQACQSLAAAHQRLLDNLSTVVLELDGRGNLTFLNKAWSRLTGFSIQESLHKPLENYIPREGAGGQAQYLDCLNALLSGQMSDCKYELQLHNREDQPIWVECKMNAVVNEQDELTILGCLDNISDRKRVQNQLEFLAMHDHLTGLYNRHYFDNALCHLAASSARGNGCHALVYLDLDHFKAINDTHGHYHGDIILREISALLASRTRKSDILCRIGGDEFALLAADTDRLQAKRLAEETRRQILGYQTQIGDDQVNLGCSIGVCEIDGRANGPEEYLKQADIALYVAKRRGRNRVHLFSPEDTESDELRSSFEWVRLLRRRIKENLLVLYVQPVVDIRTGEISYYSGALRMAGPDGNIVPQEQFIPSLELAGEMTLLDQEIIKLSVEALRNNPHINRLAVKLSGQAFRNDELFSLLRRLLAVDHVAPDRLIFELTECAGMVHLAHTQQIIGALKNLGCKFLVDDFGNGFSSFSFLKQLPAELLKVNGGFIAQIERNQVDRALVRAICDVAKALDIRTVAENVSNETVRECVRQLGIDYAQGEVIGKPERLDLVNSAGQDTAGLGEIKEPATLQPVECEN